MTAPAPLIPLLPEEPASSALVLQAAAAGLVAAEAAPKGYWDLVWGQFRKNRIALSSVVTIFLLLLMAAWSPILANGRPFIWRKDGVTSYPLLQNLVAPAETMSIDYFFNYGFFASLAIPLALLAGWLLLRQAAPPRAFHKRWPFFVLAGLFVAALPFIAFKDGKVFRKWRLDAVNYQHMALSLDPSRGDYALFTLLPEDPLVGARETPEFPEDGFLKAPSRKHPLGTDKDGRDVLARMLHGARISLSVGFVAVAIEVLLGIFFGALAGYYRGWVDIVISRFIELVICFPSFFLILTIVAFIEPERRSVFHIMIVIGVTGWTGVARLVRGEFLKLTELDFVQAARALGCSGSRLMFRHILPNALSPVLVAAAFGVAGAILTESSLSYLGFGAPPPTPTWGEMISQGKEHLEAAWWLIVFPGISIFFTVTIYNLAGDGLRDAMDPKMRT